MAPPVQTAEPRVRGIVVTPTPGEARPTAAASVTPPRAPAPRSPLPPTSIPLGPEALVREVGDVGQSRAVMQAKRLTDAALLESSRTADLVHAVASAEGPTEYDKDRMVRLYLAAHVLRDEVASRPQLGQVDPAQPDVSGTSVLTGITATLGTDAFVGRADDPNAAAKAARLAMRLPNETLLRSAQAIDTAIGVLEAKQQQPGDAEKLQRARIAREAVGAQISERGLERVAAAAPKPRPQTQPVPQPRRDRGVEL